MLAAGGSSREPQPSAMRQKCTVCFAFTQGPASLASCASTEKRANPYTRSTVLTGEKGLSSIHTGQRAQSSRGYVLFFRDNESESRG
jgi:hypothetical protein